MIDAILVFADIPRFGQFFIEVLIVVLGAILIFLRWFESRRSEKRTGYQRWITICTILMLLLTGLGVVLRRKEMRTNEALSARNDTKAKQQNNKIVALEKNAAESARKAQAAGREIVKGKKLIAAANERAEIALRENKEERVARTQGRDRDFK